ncbi:glycoside hydrolase family 128 protein [Aplosporella prunicola CBS 121167]|uniref:Glycoside hydrolase family 128 protein n=1 Tax=Aplosporella prunicola CBS 121167 TaxID=1176127 RepID=A0A6A6BX86_9PEZI|nr:glycoside hydrolase family 128 protein [Aplosporella prunicola CBS 121167]KAF2147517.1 glycoside hydrolase family 128 protein [Aplosporella prunicola CBS 121167]
MRPTTFVTALAAAALTTPVTATPQRGLIYIPNSAHPTDDTIWTSGSSSLTWYYNYGVTPSASLSSTSLSFIPMLWGDPNPADTSAASAVAAFAASISAQISAGAALTHVLAFNEPDGSSSTGGSGIAPARAAALWQAGVKPLREKGLKVGAPAVTGSPSGLVWLEKFYAACNGGCEPDFLPLHWYGNFEGFASFLGQVGATYPGVELWVTEFAWDHQELGASEAFFNQSTTYMDGLANIARYAYFGSFRTDASNIGPNAAMLSSSGKLTRIGAWYLESGGEASAALPAVRPSLCWVAGLVVAVALTLA